MSYENVEYSEYTFPDVDNNNISSIMNVNTHNIITNTYDNNISSEPNYTLLNTTSESSTCQKSFNSENKLLKELLTQWNLQSLYKTCIRNYAKTNINVI